jgi:Cu-Zn family superoxide dismutase
MGPAEATLRRFGFRAKKIYQNFQPVLKRTNPMTKSLLSIATLLLCGPLSLATAADKPHEHEHEPSPAKDAVCVLTPTSGSQVSGTLTLTQEKGDVLVKGSVAGLKPGLHGFHIHMYGDLRKADGTSAGGHYNPAGHEHGGPDSKEHHAGDLGNIKAGEDGVANVDIKATDLHLHFIIGRAIVVHADADDFKTPKTGNAGARIGVGVIGVANMEPPAKK